MDTVETTVPLVNCEGIVKNFGGVRALRGADFELLPGEVHALLGQNGAGKSTLIKILVGVHQKDGGTIKIGGELREFKTTADAQAAGIGVVYQELSLVPSMSVAANMFLGREPQRLGIVHRRQIIRDARTLLESYGLELDPRAVVERLAFPYRQQTEIAKALSMSASVLVLDEPTSSLSKGEEEILFDAITQVTKQGVGVIYITHRLPEVFCISDRVTVFRDGSNVATFDTASTDLSSLVAAIVGPGHGELRREEVEALVLGTQTRRPGDRPVPAAVSENDVAGPGPSPIAGHAADEPLLLELRDVSNDRLRGVDLTVAAGEVVGLAGMVGSGRSEILETIFGLRSVVSGEVRVRGKRVTFRDSTDAIQHGIALAPEDRHLEGLVTEHSIERNVALPRLRQLGRHGLFRRAASNARAQKAMDELSVQAPSFNTRVETLSGGNQQKVVFGKWREPVPVLLLLDEPTAGVDVGARQEIYEIIDGVSARGSAVLIVSSELAELLIVCDRIGIVSDGQMTKWITRREVGTEEDLHRLVQESEEHHLHSKA